MLDTHRAGNIELSKFVAPRFGSRTLSPLVASSGYGTSAYSPPTKSDLEIKALFAQAKEAALLNTQWQRVPRPSTTLKAISKPETTTSRLSSSTAKVPTTIPGKVSTKPEKRASKPKMTKKPKKVLLLLSLNLKIRLQKICAE